jgi:hypothetical protein
MKEYIKYTVYIYLFIYFLLTFLYPLNFQENNKYFYL